MSDDEQPKWELFADGGLYRIKVEGGYLYSVNETLCLVPDIDLKRYESHLRDAYTKGFDEGFNEAKAKYGALLNIPEMTQTPDF